MKNPILCRLLIGLFALLLIVPLASDHVYANTQSKQRVFDDAELLTQEEIQNLEEAAEEHGANRETDFIILTTPDADGKDVKKYMQDTYDEEGFGYDKEHGNTAVLAIDMESREFYLAGFYKAEKYLDSDRLDQIRDKITPDLANGDYYDAFYLFIETADKYMGYRPGINPESIFLKTTFQLFVSLALAGIIVFSMAYNSKTKITTTPRTYRDEKTSKVLKKQDIFLRKSVTKTRKPQNNSSSGGGRGGGGGGMTGGGHSHSGSRGSF